jgi:pantoate--beta-alanine ligase
MEAAHRRATDVAVTVFVNPTQFGPGEDFEAYPRPLEADLETCRNADVSLVFVPDAAEMYPQGEATRVRVSRLTEVLCGASRPGHFEGVTTIVTKLFSVTGPCVAVFGRKDYQQLKVIERMTRDLLLPVEIVDHPTVRDSDGLATSSRNSYMKAHERKRALAIPRALAAAAQGFRAGERRAGALRKPGEEALELAGLRIDYVTLADPEELVPFSDRDTVSDRALFAIAAFAGSTRLIDNLVLGEDAPPSVDQEGAG